MMTKEVTASLLTHEDNEIDLTLSGYAQRIKKSLSDEVQEDCIMEMGEALNRYIRASHYKLAPTSTISSPPAGSAHNNNGGVIPLQHNLDLTIQGQQSYPSMPPLMKMGNSSSGEVFRDNNLTFYNM